MKEKNIPGYIDLQVNGLKGVDYSDLKLSEDSFVFSCRELVKNGTVGFLPTIITSPDDLLERNLKLMTSALRFKEFSQLVLGFHLEGPFISKEDGARGAHNRDWVKEPNLEWLKKVQKASGGRIKIVSIAAEHKGVEKFIKAANKMGILVSLGHQLANSKEIGIAVKAGAKALTHLGNGLPQKIDRFNNPLWPALAEDKLTAMFIADGWHLTDSMMKVFFRSKGIERLVAVSDASPMALMPPGEYFTLGNKVIIEKGGRLYNPDTGYLVGSWSTMKECVNYMKQLDFLSDDDIERLVYYNPLKLIGM
jgi:N-acetylglucosamine-6-phosphate deacetylase